MCLDKKVNVLGYLNILIKSIANYRHTYQDYKIMFYTENGVKFLFYNLAAGKIECKRHATQYLSCGFERHWSR